MYAKKLWKINMKCKEKSVEVVLNRLPTEEIGNADQHLMDEDDI